VESTIYDVFMFAEDDEECEDLSVRGGWCGNRL